MILGLGVVVYRPVLGKSCHVHRADVKALERLLAIAAARCPEIISAERVGNEFGVTRADHPLALGAPPANVEE